MKQPVIFIAQQGDQSTFSNENIYKAAPECLSIGSIQTEPLPNISRFQTLHPIIDFT